MNDFTPFRFWCAKVLPLVYDDSLSYYELLCKCIKALNEIGTTVSALTEAFEDLKKEVDAELASVDTKIAEAVETVMESMNELIQAKLDAWAEDGTLDDIMASTIGTNALVPSQYSGDIIFDANFHCSACVVNSDLKLAYLLLAPRASYAIANTSDNGSIQVWDLSANTYVTSYTVKAGHGNSMCYDPDNEKLYIVPLYTYTSGSETAVRKIYSYGLSNTTGILDTASFAEMDIPADDVSVFGITFNNTDDASLRGVYFITYNYQIYKMNADGNSYSTFYNPLDLNQSKDFGANDAEQGLAAKGARFYVTSARGKIFAFNVKLVTGQLPIKRIFTKFISDFDIATNRPFGEIQDLEFAKDGNLYAASTLTLVKINSTDYAGAEEGYLIRILLEGISRGERYSQRFQTRYAITNNTYSITTSSVGMFHNNYTEIKHPAQINYFAKIDCVDCLKIDTYEYFRKIVFTVPVAINVPANGKFYFGQIEAQNGQIEIEVASGGKLILSTDYETAFYAVRNGAFAFGGDAITMDNLSGSDVKVIPSLTKALTKVRELPVLVNSADFVIGTSAIDTAGIYYGESRLALAAELPD